ncbi:hypothetical protein GE09DRAFT_1243498 [Coniochaeta sp. 2T2.1]|nr:hypothetical protein GE09DRAFT_1243498 [Coniochaeta sp. 2T2.1]
MDQGWAALRDALPTPCRYFLAGNCQRGVRCQFSHDQPAGDHATTPRARNGGPRPPCIYFPRGVCKKGDACQYSHDTNAEVPKIPCKHFAKGSCFAGDNCRWFHDLEMVEIQHTSPRQVPQSEGHGMKRDDSLSEDFTRPISGGVVQYGDGATVEKISLDADYSTVRLINLPAGSTKQSVLDMLRRLDINMSLDYIRVYSIKLIAELRSTDPDFAKTVSSKILPNRRGDVQVAHFATTLTKPTFGAAGRHSTTKKVHVSWYRPTRTVWLKFDNESLAKVAKACFDSGEYKFRERVVKAKLSTTQPRRDRAVWTVELTSLPADTTETLVRAIFKPDQQPKYVMLSSVSYTASDQDACAAVQSMLSEVGDLAWFEDTSGSGGTRLKALACFKREDDARRAFEELNNLEAPFSSHVKLVLDLAHSIKLKFFKRIYDVVEPELQELKTKWEKEKHLNFYDYSADRLFKGLKIEGQKSEDVVAAAEEVEALVSGIVAMDGKTALWNPALGSGSGLLQKVQDIEQSARVIILCDKMKARIRVIGPSARQDIAIQLLTEAIKEEKSAYFSIDLTTEQYEWARQGGFRAITAKLGRNVAKLDLLSDPKRIVILGSQLQYMTARFLLLEMQEVHSTAGKDDCSICWAEAEDPVRTACDHLYCSDCFEGLVHSAASTLGRIECKGDGDTCHKLVSLVDLSKHLTSSGFEKVLSQSFRSYISARPLEYRHCSTTDCPQIFRTATSGAHHCTECLKTTCKTCGESHDGMSCDQKNEHSSEEQLQLRKLKWELGIKDCPKCKTSIEKTDGCNHMTCGGCGAHVCWVCLKFFSTSGRCYSHLTEAHGGFGL